MKTLSTPLRLMLAFAVCIGLASCVKNETTPTVNEEEPDVYTVKLGWSGEIDINEEPLTRAGEAASLYGIEVYSAPYSGEEAEGQNTDWSRYAYGLYGSSENITINLLKGFKYKFAATMVEDGQNKIHFNTYNNTYDYPYCVELNNTFIYQATSDFSWAFYYGLTRPANGQLLYRPNGVNRYFGELSDYVPGLQKEEKATIQMKRTNYGAKFIAQGSLANSGSLEIKMQDAATVNMDLANGVKEYFDVYTFYNVQDAYKYDKGDYTETVDVTINWCQADGKVVPFGTHKITYKRNATTVVTVKMESTDAENKIGIECEEGELVEDGENDVTIENGERVDTNIEGNTK